MDLRIIGKLHNIYNSNPENPIVTELPGWHVNTTHAHELLEPYRVEPTTPREQFYGVPTYYYTFANQSAWEIFFAQHEEQLMSQPVITPSQRITRLAFMQRFTQAERVAIRQAAKTAPEIEDYLAMVDAATFIDLARPDTISSVNALASAELLTPARAVEIISQPVNAAEAYN